MGHRTTAKVDDLYLAKLTRNFILGILFAWSRTYFSIILIIVNCCIRIIYDIVGTVCSLEWFNSAETRSLFSNNFMSGWWWYRSQNCWNFSWEALSCTGISSQFLQDWQTTFQFCYWHSSDICCKRTKQYHMLDYEIYYFVGALSLTIL
jgi:hypothetical protein